MQIEPAGYFSQSDWWLFNQAANPHIREPMNTSTHLPTWLVSYQSRQLLVCTSTWIVQPCVILCFCWNIEALFCAFVCLLRLSACLTCSRSAREHFHSLNSFILIQFNVVLSLHQLSLWPVWMHFIHLLVLSNFRVWSRTCIIHCLPFLLFSLACLGMLLSLGYIPLCCVLFFLLLLFFFSSCRVSSYS